MGIPTINTFANGVSGWWLRRVCQCVSQNSSKNLRCRRWSIWIQLGVSSSSCGYPATPKNAGWFLWGKIPSRNGWWFRGSIICGTPQTVWFKRFDAVDFSGLLIIHPNHDSNHFQTDQTGISNVWCFFPKVERQPWKLLEVLAKLSPDHRDRAVEVVWDDGERSTREDRVVPQMLPRWFISKLVD